MDCFGSYLLYIFKLLM